MHVENVRVPNVAVTILFISDPPQIQDNTSSIAVHEKEFLQYSSQALLIKCGEERRAWYPLHASTCFGSIQVCIFKAWDSA